MPSLAGPVLVSGGPDQTHYCGRGTAGGVDPSCDLVSSVNSHKRNIHRARMHPTVHLFLQPVCDITVGCSSQQVDLSACCSTQDVLAVPASMWTSCSRCAHHAVNCFYLLCGHRTGNTLTGSLPKFVQNLPQTQKMQGVVLTTGRTVKTRFQSVSSGATSQPTTDWPHKIGGKYLQGR